MKKDSNILFDHRLEVLPYQIGLRIVLAHQLVEARNKIFPVCVKYLNDQTEKVGQYVDCSLGRGLFFKSGRTLTHGTIAHEVFHATHHILRWSGDTFAFKHQEPYSWFADWLTDEVYAQLKKAKIRVR